MFSEEIAEFMDTQFNKIVNIFKDFFDNNPNEIPNSDFKLIIISSSTCTGCKKCIDNCPVSILEIKDNVASVKSLQNGKCIDCKECEKSCQMSAIKVY